MELEVVLGARSLITKDQPVIWAENEPFFKQKPPDRTFVDTMKSEFDYDCNTVADLELLCTPPERTDSVLTGINGAMKHLNMPLRLVSLQQVLEVMDPGFSQEL